jgi:hypothetical protein
MTELERALERLAADVGWPSTPPFELRLARGGRRRRLYLAAALVLLAVGIAFAVPPARSAILRFLHIGGVTIERVGTLPASEERPLSASLGVPTSRADARALLGTPFRTPDHVESQLYRSGQVVSALLATPDPVLLTELRAGVSGDVLVKKLVGTSTGVRGVDLGFAAPAVWLEGREHVYLAPPLPARLAGNTLIWVRGRITYRLEGKTLSLELARTLARRISG